jgi:hypothetical protein
MVRLGRGGRLGPGVLYGDGGAAARGQDREQRGACG